MLSKTGQLFNGVNVVLGGIGPGLRSYGLGSAVSRVVSPPTFWSSGGRVQHARTVEGYARPCQAHYQRGQVFLSQGKSEEAVATLPPSSYLEVCDA